MAIATPSNGRGGFDYSFVDAPPDELVCKICHHPSREPHLSVCCGHTFCKTCLDDAKRFKRTVSVDEEAKNACPVCREKNFTAFPNKQNERAVKSLHVLCTNKNKGCHWQGELNSIVDHLVNNNGCPFEEVSCSNECGLSLQRQHLRKHLDAECPRNKVTCQYCNTIGEHQFINGQHQKEECPQFPLSCPNKCKVGRILRENMEAHRAECPLEMIQCEYYEIGCKDSMARKDEVKHNKEEMENHLSLMKSEYLHTKRKLAELESSMEHRIQLVENMMFKHVFQWYATLEERVKSQYPKIPITLKMSEYSKKKEWYSNNFSWELSAFDKYPKMKLQIIPAGYNGKGTHLSIKLYLVKGGCKKDFIALEHQIQSQQMNNLIDSWEQGVFYRITRGRQERERLEKELKELKEKQKLWEKNSLAYLHVMILNQITDSEHYCVQTNQIDLEADHFLTNKDCNVLIFDSPCFVSNEVLHKSTATCRYLQDDNVYFLIKVA